MIEFEASRSAKEQVRMTAIGNWFVLGYAGLVVVSLAVLVWMSRDRESGLGRSPHRRSRCAGRGAR